MPHDHAMAPMPPQTARLIVSPRSTLRGLLLAAVVVTLAGIAGELARNIAPDNDHPVAQSLRIFRRNFSPSGEQTVGSWFTASILLTSGLVLFAIAAATRTAGGRDAGHWRTLAGLLIFLSCDETASLHEQIGDWVNGFVATGGVLL